jgi:hypothetical protein
MRGARGVINVRFAAVALCSVMASVSLSARAEKAWLERYEGGERSFRELKVNGALTVFYHQRTIGDARVEKDIIIYRFDSGTGELRDKIVRWRDDLPASLPPLSIRREQARFMAKGDIQEAELLYIDPESDVFPFDPPPANPCWVVRSLRGDELLLTAIDAVTGRLLGYGIPPPYAAYSLTGPTSDSPCSGSWAAWAVSAEQWFEAMGYSTQMTVWPTKTEIQSHVSSFETALFYELAHGGSTAFSHSCAGGYLNTLAADVGNWIEGYPKMPFAFIGSCEGLCNTGTGSFSFEFRKGSVEGTATVGYCGMATPECESCWSVSIDWQDDLFYWMSEGYSVKDAFDLANAAHPSCLASTCMRFAGDELFAVVPLVLRSAWGDLADATAAPLGDGGDGGGAAWFDTDGDGDQDLYIVNQNQANVLLRNDGAGSFADVTVSPLDDVGVGGAAATADYDNDGDLDLYLSNRGGANKLLRRDSGAFVDASGWPLDDAGDGGGVAWADFNNDGLLDLYLVNDGAANKLFVSYGELGGGWVFAPASDPVAGDAGHGACAAWADYDNDGDQDLYLTNRFEPNRLLQNNWPAGFIDAAAGGPAADGRNGAGCAWGDYDNDGDLDLYLANDGQPDVLLKNTGFGFTSVAGYPLENGGPCRGVSWGDYDNDGDLDLYLARHGLTDLLLRNDGGDQFHEFYIAGTDGNSNGAAWVDYDGDGFLDVYVTCDGANMLLENQTANGNHWLQVKPVGVDANRSAVGARVRIVAGGLAQIREIASGSGYMSQEPLLAVFGLGAAAVIDTLEIRWPGGGRQRLVAVAVDQLVTIQQENLTGAAPLPGAGATLALQPFYPNPFNPAATIRYDLPGARPVRLQVYDVSGRLVRILVDGEIQLAGRHEIVWDGRDDTGQAAASGVYLCRLQAGIESRIRRLVLAK